jgi:hypothetical protein
VCLLMCVTDVSTDVLTATAAGTYDGAVLIGILCDATVGINARNGLLFKVWKSG